MVDSRIGENVLFSFCLRVSFLRVGGRMLHGELTWTIALSVFLVLFPFMFPFAVPLVNDILRLTETLSINHFHEKTGNSIRLENKMVRAQLRLGCFREDGLSFEALPNFYFLWPLRLTWVYFVAGPSPARSILTAECLRKSRFSTGWFVYSLSFVKWWMVS